jgi:hypothetical protein
VRAIGPELTPYGVPNVLADPTLELHDAAGALIASNDNWQHTIIGGIITADQVAEIQNSGHAPTVATESAIIANLPPGNYSASCASNRTDTCIACKTTDNEQRQKKFFHRLPNSRLMI